MAPPDDTGSYEELVRRADAADRRIDSVQDDIKGLVSDTGYIKGTVQAMNGNLEQLAEHCRETTASPTGHVPELLKTVRWFIVVAAVMGLAWAGFNNFRGEGGGMSIDTSRQSDK